jgi:hypothetical protein
VGQGTRAILGGEDNLKLFAICDMALDLDDTSDLRLPDELQFIAEQLAEDAGHLERTFPANAPRNWRRAFAVSLAQKVQAPRRSARVAAADGDRRSASVFSSIAAAAVVVVLAGWYVFSYQNGQAGRGSPSAARHSGPSGQPGRVVPAGVMSGFGAFLGTQPQHQPAIVPGMGAEYFNKMFTGPEQEAIIDIFHEHQIREPSLRY